MPRGHHDRRRHRRGDLHERYRTVLDLSGPDHHRSDTDRGGNRRGDSLAHCTALAGRLSPRRTRGAGPAAPHRQRHPQVPNEEIELIAGLTLRRPPPTTTYIHRTVRTVAAERGWPPPRYNTRAVVSARRYARCSRTAPRRRRGHPGRATTALHIMRKGPCMQRKVHCPQLAGAASDVGFYGADRRH